MTEYIWEVGHEKYGNVTVTAPDRLHAIVKACNIWGERWTMIATRCYTLNKGTAPDQEEHGDIKEKRNGNSKKRKPHSA